MIKCTHCSSSHYWRKGTRSTQNNGLKTQYFCRTCRKRFIADDGFKRARVDKKMITIALDLRAKGLSLAQVKDHLNDMHGVLVTRTSISNWEKKYG